ncbi:unnamed protein product [Symbiodinium necroappetens]|uniref:Uncharacterized protein n=1 Tax=Symbiodinium necroappetens TaxID=1628268 RepID=A0A812LWB1_9DINO|nr:unnamed protein product [Symbiodinium necroappetens]
MAFLTLKSTFIDITSTEFEDAVDLRPRAYSEPADMWHLHQDVDPDEESNRLQMEYVAVLEDRASNLASGTEVELLPGQRADPDAGLRSASTAYESCCCAEETDRDTDSVEEIWDADFFA